jgi:phytoene synthase
MQLLSPETRPDATADMMACRASIRVGSRSFFAASLLLPRRVRRPASVIYAFCRIADDAIDIDGDPALALGQLRDRLARIYQGRPLSIGSDRAFADLVSEFAIPRALPEALLEGFEWDAVGRRYENYSDLKDYAVRVAGSVGAMMAIIMGARSEEAVARACDLGVAMQMTNIARDVGEDARNGRIYLPLQWLQQAGVKPDCWLAHPVFDPGIGYAVQRLLRSADLMYQRADAGIPLLPVSCQPGIRAARALYAEIGREVTRANYDSVSWRAVVPAQRKMSVIARALLRPSTYEASNCATVGRVPESWFLVDAVSSGAGRTADRPCVRGVEARVAWVLELFERLERRQELQHPQ